MGQLDTQEYENSPQSIGDAVQNLTHMGDPQVLDDWRGFQVGNTDFDSPSRFGLATPTSIGQSPHTVSSSECYPSGQDMGERMWTESDLEDATGMESYPTPVSNPSLTPKVANRVLKRKPCTVTKGKANRGHIGMPAPTLPALVRGHSSPSNEAKSVRMDLLRYLVSRANTVIGDRKLCMIRELGDQIVSDTCTILDAWTEWLPREFQPISLPPYRSLSTLEKCVAASRILVEPKDGSHHKSMHRRLAQVLLYLFAPVLAKELETREENGEVFHRNGLRPITMAHDMILERVNSDLELWNRDRVVNSKNYGKRWWRLGSGIGMITVLTCPSHLVIGEL